MAKQICGFCESPFEDSENHSTACRYHPQFYFPYDIDTEGDHSKGWQCCRNTDEDAEGCKISFHRSDVRKVYRGFSFAYDFVEIDFAEEKRKEEQAQARAAQRRKREENPRFVQLRERLEAFIGRREEELFASIGRPNLEEGVSSTTSGITYRRFYYLYQVDGFSFVFETERVCIRSILGKVDPPYTILLKSLQFFIDDEEYALYLSELRKWKYAG
jgi:hypothetical protein